MHYQIVEVGSLAEKKRWLRDFDPLRAQWVVSDIKSKNEIRQMLIAERGWIPGESVIRASELWRKLLGKSARAKCLVSTSFLKMAIGEALREKSIAGNDNEHRYTAHQILAATELFLPVFAQSDGEAVLVDWFREHPHSFLNWGHWYVVARKTWDYLAQKGWVHPKWAASLLSGESVDHLQIPRGLNFVFDLGAAASASELEILKKLGEVANVEILVPNAQWRARYNTLFSPYGFSESKLESNEFYLPHLKLRRLPTWLAEVKHATAQVRRWLDEGVEPGQIAVMAPTFSNYRSPLISHFQQEGIQVNDLAQDRLSSFLFPQWVLARLRVLAGLARCSDLELALFHARPEPPMSFAEFKRYYVNFYKPKDVYRHPVISQHFFEKHDRMTSYEFLKFFKDDLVAHCPEELLNDPQNIKIFEKLCDQLLAEVPSEEAFEFKSWVGYLEAVFAEPAFLGLQENNFGVIACDLVSAEWVNSTHQVILGLTENQMKLTNPLPLPRADLEKLKKDLAFPLDSLESSLLEFELEWSVSGERHETHLLSASCDWEGQTLAPSVWWIRKALENKVPTRALSAPEPTRWDEIQKRSCSEILEIRGWSESRKLSFQEALAVDLSQKAQSPFGQNQVRGLSASSFRNYLSCPFKLAASKLFKLTETSALDFVLGPKEQGTWLHAIAEKIISEKELEGLDEEDLEKLFDRARQEAGLYLLDKALWPILAKSLKKFARQFVEKEIQRRRLFPNSKVLKPELDFQIWWDPQTNTFSSEARGAYIHLRGRIDRVDGNDKGQVIVTDYKSSVGSLRQWMSWVKNDDLQLPLYILAMEKGWTELGQKEVVGAFYYGLQDGDCTRGLRLENTAQDLFSDQAPGKNFINESEKAALLQDIGKAMQSAAHRIRTGQFPTEPKNKLECPNCEWRSMCRAPHLNL